MEPKASARHEGVIRILRRLPAYIYLHDVFYDRRVLEIGCGDGAAAAYLARGCAQTVVGIDRDGPLIAEAQKRHRAANLTFRAVSDYGLTDLEDRSFDVVCVPPGGVGLAGAGDPARWVGFLEEVRRILARGGSLVLAAPSADRSGRPVGPGGVSYHELINRLEPLFGTVRMIGVQPFLGLSLVEYDEEAELEELELDTSLTSLGEGRDGVVEYVAIAGGAQESLPRGFLLVELPTAEGSATLADARGEALEASDPDGATSVHTARMEERLREAEAAHAEALLRLKDAEGRGRGGDDGDLRRRLAKVVEERAALEAELEQLAVRLSVSEEEVGRVAGQAAIELQEARSRIQAFENLSGGSAELDAAQRAVEDLTRAAAAHAEQTRSVEESLVERDAYVDELRTELDETLRAAREAADGARTASSRHDELEQETRDLRRRLAAAEGALLSAKLSGSAPAPAPAPGADPALAEKLAAAETAAEKANTRWKEAEAKSDELWRKIGDMQREMEAAREQSVENARAQRQAAQIALTRAVDEASRKLVSAKDDLVRTERERAEREREAQTLRAEKAELISRLEDTEGRAAQAESSAAGNQSTLDAEREGARAREAALLETVRVRDRQLAEREASALPPVPRMTEPDPGVLLDLASARGELEAVRGELYGALHDLGLAKREVEELRVALTHAEASLSEERDSREAAQVELEFVRGELTQMRHDLASAMQVGNAPAVPVAQPPRPDPGVAAKLDEVTRALRDVEEAVSEEERHLSEIEGALFSARDEASNLELAPLRPARGTSEGDPVLLDERVRVLSEELGSRDAELAIMHGTVATGRRRAAELVERIRAVRERAALVSSSEMTQLLDRLADEAMRIGS